MLGNAGRLAFWGWLRFFVGTAGGYNTEDPAHHRMRGGNVLYADAHVSFETLPDVVQFVAKLEAGRNPRISPLSEKQAKAIYEKTWKPKLTSMLNGTWGASLPHPTTQPVVR